MKTIVLALIAFASLGVTATVSFAQERPAREVTLAENDGLKAVVRIQSLATLADSGWLQIEITNSGVPGRIKTLQLDAPYEHDGVSNSDVLYGVGLGLPTGRSPNTSIGNTIPEGKYSTSTPGIVAGSRFGLPQSDRSYVMHITLNLVLEDGRSLQMIKPGVPLPFVWMRPSETQIAGLQQQAVTLLTKAMTGRAVLTLPEESMMRLLLATEATSRQVSLDLALAALKQRQVEQSTRFGEVLALVMNRWKSDPAVIAFYGESLRARGPQAAMDLYSISGSSWDVSFVEPIVMLVEKGAQTPINSTAVSYGISLLDRHFVSWSKDTSIPPRLSKAAIEAHSALKDQSGTVGAFYNFAGVLAESHDPAMIQFLRRYLADKTIDFYTSMSANMPYGVTPMRYSELAANAIARLLGEPAIFDPWKRAKAPKDGPYPEWTEWDEKIVALQRRLGATTKP